VCGSHERCSTVWRRSTTPSDQLVSYFGRRLVDEAGIESEQLVLDVACGRGAMLFPVAERLHLPAMALLQIAANSASSRSRPFDTVSTHGKFAEPDAITAHMREEAAWQTLSNHH
jgi:cyclopropane fatty-acyl-phospholipid synthase-like methyltransferase